MYESFFNLDFRDIIQEKAAFINSIFYYMIKLYFCIRQINRKFINPFEEKLVLFNCLVLILYGLL